MKITYSISAEDFYSLQPPLTLRPGRNLGFRAALLFCGLVAALGIYGVAQGMGWLLGGFLLALSAATCGLAYFLEKRSVRNAIASHQRKIATAYQSLHCRDARTLETNEEGFTTSCKCGTVARPWAALLRFSETSRVFLLGTKTDSQILPKSAFASEGERTEFRSLLADRLNDGKLLTARPVTFAYTKQDFRNGYLLNLWAAGGWRKLAWMLVIYFSSAYVGVMVWKVMSPKGDPALLCGIIGAMIAVPLLRLSKFRRKRYYVPLTLFFGEDGIHVQYPATLSRTPWKQFIGYLEDERVFLLYQSPRSFSLIPKRALGERAAEFHGLLERNLQPYDYRSPFAAAAAQANQTPVRQ